VKKAETLAGDMRREYPATPEEAFEQALEGAYFAQDLFAAAKRGRIGGFPYDPKATVPTFWDLGRNDLNTSWLHQHERPRRVNRPRPRARIGGTCALAITSRVRRLSYEGAVPKTFPPMTRDLEHPYLFRRLGRLFLCLCSREYPSHGRCLLSGREWAVLP
jgi:hypothetical protein